MAFVVGWAAATLGADVRAGSLNVWSAIRSFGGNNGKRLREGRPVAGAILVIAMLIVAVPIFGDMMNFDPDVHMRQDAPIGVGLFGDTSNTASHSPSFTTVTPGQGSTSATPARGSSSAPAARNDSLVVPADLVPGPVAGSFVTAGALSTAHPWSTHPPTGGGRVYSVNLPAPWIGGLTDHATIDIYLPPGYDSSLERYPVIYEPHQPEWAWQRGMRFTSIVDDLIRTGTIPPEIVVFIDQYGGPYADTECADSWDGKEWFDRYLGQTVPAWVDANLRTIATPAARTLFGFSSGGYCAAAGLTHHPDVFDTAIIFSGYFVSGIHTTTTPVAYLPFNNDPAREAAQSPINIVPTLPADVRSRLFVAFSADPANAFYGAQITAFAHVLDASGASVAILPTPLGHSWAAVREQVPAVLTILAERQVTLGMFLGTP